MSDTIPSTPQVNILTPAPDIDTSHHGPFVSHYFRKNTAYENGLPRFFKNPWPSYRAPSLKDAYTAYNLGAAIAHPLPYRLRMSRSELQLAHNQGKDAYKTEDGTDAPRLKNESWLPQNTYVRPIFAEQFEDDEEQDWRDPPVQVIQPTFASEQTDKAKVTWLGHAGVLVQVPWQRGERDGMFGVLYDPIFSYSQYVGPARHLDPPCPVSMLPDIHVVCISHDHYDHLDYQTILDIWKYHQRTVHFMVPLALKPWFEQCKIPSDRITELDWWHEAILTVPSSSTYSSSTPAIASGGRHDKYDMAVKFAFTPAQHRSGRGVLDHMKTLWGSWCFGVIEEAEWVKREERGMRGWKGFKCFFGGDTGYRFACAPDGDDSAICPAFEEIASHYSPFNLSLLPLNTGSSLPFLRTILSLSLDQYTLTSAQHCSPADALEIHRIVQAERTLGMHWGTFCDKDESRGTRVEFGRARRERGVSGLWQGEEGTGTEGRGRDGEMDSEGKGRFVLGDIGETFVFP